MPTYEIYGLHNPTPKVLSCKQVSKKPRHRDVVHYVYTGGWFYLSNDDYQEMLMEALGRDFIEWDRDWQRLISRRGVFKYVYA